jgi:hypothetical protein
MKDGSFRLSALGFSAYPLLGDFFDKQALGAELVAGLARRIGGDRTADVAGGGVQGLIGKDGHRRSDNRDPSGNARSSRGRNGHGRHRAPRPARSWPVSLALRLSSTFSSWPAAGICRSPG